MNMNIVTSVGNYDIIIESGSLQRAGEHFELNRKVLVVTDSGVPEQYAMTIASQCAEAVLFVFKQGETSKTMDTYTAILHALTDNAFTRTDCIVAVGGGVVSDLAGFAAATYMRGIDFYSVPTTLLAQVDASIGGKTAVDFMGYKNLIGVFNPPKGVLIDIETLSTLSRRHISSGMAEVIKMAATCDAQLFEMLEITEDVSEDIIYRALKIKGEIVMADERESGIRKVLNFGHTLGHAYESVAGNLTHGECVAVGMLPFCHPCCADRVKSLLEKWSLPTSSDYSDEAVIAACRHDKKNVSDSISLVTVPEIGKNEIKTIPFSKFKEWYRGRKRYEEYIWQ